MGGDATAARKLETFTTSLNASRDAPYLWSGNEPGEWAPWEFDYFGAPQQTQRVVRAIVNTEYADAPVDEPGNDDLGAISSWYVWGALGLFPVTPGSADLALASPLFPSVTITLPDGRRLVEEAPGAAASRPYVHALTVSGVTRPTPEPGCVLPPGTDAHAGTWGLSWLPASVLATGGTLHYTLADAPAAAAVWPPSASPPSFGTDQLPAVGFSSPSGATTASVGQPVTVHIGMALAGYQTTSVHWQVAAVPAGLQVAPSSGTLTLGLATGGPGAPPMCALPSPTTQSLAVTAAAAGTYPLRIEMTTTGGTELPPVVLDVIAD